MADQQSRLEAMMKQTNSYVPLFPPTLRKVTAPRAQAITALPDGPACGRCLDMGWIKVASPTGTRGWGRDRYNLIPCGCRQK